MPPLFLHMESWTTVPIRPPDNHLQWFRDNLCYDQTHGGIRRKLKRSRLKRNYNLLGRNHKGWRRWHFRGREYLVHHVVWFLCKGVWPIAQLDHKDKNRSNNRIGNLRYDFEKKFPVVENNPLQ